MAIKDDMEDVQEAVINELISDNGLNPLTVGDLQITTAKIADDAVTLAKLGSDVDLGQVNDGAVTPAKLSQAYLPLTGGSVTGNVLVGKTTDTFSAAGTVFAASGSNMTTASAPALRLNRTGSEGEILKFYYDGAPCGDIGGGSVKLSIGREDTGIAFYPDGNFIYPSSSTGANRDNAIDLGASHTRFDNIYATNGSIQTSDRNEKQDIEALSEAEQRVAVACKGLLRKFRWKSSVEENGAEARIHFGIIAQDLQAAFEAEGLDAGRYAMFISSTWTDEETEEEKTRLGVRYSELLAFIISAI